LKKSVKKKMKEVCALVCCLESRSNESDARHHNNREW
jgi:hypothetical protein